MLLTSEKPASGGDEKTQKPDEQATRVSELQQLRKRIYMRPARRRHRESELIHGIPGSFVWIVTVVLAIAIGMTLGAANVGVRKVPPPRPAPPQPPPQIETRVKTEGFDAHHRSMAFTIYVLSQQASWKLKSVEDLEGEQQLLSPELVAAINRAHDVFCIGTASSEGSRSAEELRARQRAKVLAEWVGGAIADPKKTRVYKLSVGQYVGEDRAASSDQRKAIIIATQTHDDGVNIKEALSSGLRTKAREYPIIESLLTDYSRSGTWLKGLK